MPHQQKRQFLAVLFADIQGYTALMQRDEEQGRLVLRNFKEVLTENITQFKGAIINFYGDGCLCTFENPTNAANCAVTLQKNFKVATPTTSVRIGLRQGNVGFEDGNAYEDAVNITSRIESIPDFSCKLSLFSQCSCLFYLCLLYTSPSPRDQRGSRMPSSA